MWRDRTEAERAIIAKQRLTDSPWLCRCGQWIRFCSTPHECPDRHELGTEIEQLQAQAAARKEG